MRAASWHHALVFVTGAGVLLLEILGARLIAPFYGAALYVWSSLIIVTLAALAAGYAVGGVLADRPCPAGPGSRDQGVEGSRPIVWLGRALAGAGAWLLVLPILRRPVLIGASALGVRFGALAGAAVLLAPPLFCLAMVGPLIVRLRTAELSRLGREVGGVTAVSTVGSVAGALIAGFLLVPKAPAVGLLAGFAFVLFALAAFCSWKAGSRVARAEAAVLLAVGAAGAVWGMSRTVRTSGVVREKATSFYGDIRVVDWPRQARRVLYIDGIPNTVVSLGTLDSVSDYIMAFEMLPLMRPEGRRALLIGMGGGSLVGRFARHYGIVTDVVEIDPVIERLARRWFGFAPTGKVHIEDGRRLLERDGSEYDFIVVDAFSGDQHPYHLFSVEAFQAAKRRLSGEGVLALNVIGYAMGPRAGLRRAVGRTLKEVFGHVRVFSANRDLEMRESCVNLIFMASDAPLRFRREPRAARPRLAMYHWSVQDNFLEVGDGALITDDRNPLERLNAPAFLAIRRRMLEIDHDLRVY
ncbi:MAG: fused MFS/spermidine synthase [Elusimicrobiota bacterium]